MLFRLVLVALIPLTTAGWSEDEPKARGKTLAEWEQAVWTQKPPSHQGVRALGEMGEAAIPALIKMMRSHPGGDIRYLSQKALAKIGKPAVEPMRRVLRDGDPSAKMAAILGLETVLEDEGVAVLKPMLQDATKGVVARAAGALLRITGDAEQYLPPLVDALKSGNQGDRWIAAESLGWCGEKAAGATESLVELLQTARGGVREQVITALVRIGAKEGSEALAMERATDLSSEDTGARLKAAYELGKDPEVSRGALPALRARLADENEDILARGYCAWAIARIDAASRPEAPRTFHVSQSHPAASDGNPGTVEMPWKTIQRAAEAMFAGDTVIIGEGVYRECVRPFRGGESYEKMITYRAAPGANVVIKGSDVCSPTWEKTQIGETTGWAAPWQRLEWDHPENWPKKKEAPMQRAEQVFVDGKLLRHVGGLEELQKESGCFYTDDETGKLCLRLPDDGAPEERVIERSVRQQVFAPVVRGLGYIRVQGLKMMHAANPESNGWNWGVIGHRAAMSTRAGHHWIIEDNEITWANAQGMDIGGEGWSNDLQKQPSVSDECGYHQVRRNNVSHNGVAGIVGWAGGSNHLLLEHNVTNYNCLKGNFYAFEAAGVKLHHADHVIIRRHRSHRNEAFGIWLDHKCHHNRVTQCTLTENRAAGIFLEVSSQGPNLVDTNVVIGTRDDTHGVWGDGLYSHDADDVTWANNLVLNCQGWGARIRYIVGRKAGWGPTTAHRNRVLNNIISGNRRGCINFQPETDRGKDNLSDFNVLWGRDEPPTMFLDNGGAKVRWEETEFGNKLGFEGTGSLTLTVDQWREYGQDRDSVMQAAETLLRGLDAPIPPDEPAGKLLAALRSLWTQEFGLEDELAEYHPRPAEEIVTALSGE